MPERMIERIAATIHQMHGDPGQTWQVFGDTAYAIVRDLSEPTPKMIQSAEGKSGLEAWTCMLDVILHDHVDLGSPDALPDVEEVERNREAQIPGWSGR